MSTVSVSLPSDGSTADVGDYNTPITTLVNDYNGNIDNSNIASGAAIAGSKLADSSVPAGKVDFGGSGVGVWWQEIGRTTLGSAGDTISVASFAAKKYLKVLVYAPTSGATDIIIRFNNDSGNNYSNRYSANNAADTTSTSTAYLIAATSEASDKYAVFEVDNISAKEKLVIGHTTSYGTAGAGNAPTRWDFTGKWSNTSSQITRVDAINDQAGDFASGAEVVVLGHD